MLSPDDEKRFKAQFRRYTKEELTEVFYWLAKVQDVLLWSLK